MADKKISQLDAAGALDGSEAVAVVQSGANKKTTAQAIADLGGGGSGSFPYVGARPLVTPWIKPVAADFTSWINQSSGTTNATLQDQSGDLPLILRAAADASDGLITAALKTPDHSPPWTITTMQAVWSSKRSIMSYPIVLHDSGTGKALAIYWNGTVTGSNVNLLEGVYSFANTNTGTYGSNKDDGTVGAPFSDYALWFKVTFAGGILTFQTGPDGLLWDDFIVSGANGFLTTIDGVGFGFDRFPGAGSVGNVTSLLWDWEETTP